MSMVGKDNVECCNEYRAGGKVLIDRLSFGIGLVSSIWCRKGRRGMSDVHSLLMLWGYEKARFSS